ncbi:uncharacterized protein LOC126237407 [Schistocerca nitens]|uniref:uncharacterized protein LOC126237407 n=1 Tax=Schistocerca nitens TaxID=7011 RepID=UPI0021198476|nr:uncharacterized protein LOC126237407 [Schistocerca nitens]XP_049803464.1 uncharacterized protein LOC126237407 [Schistocerca nitens]
MDEMADVPLDELGEATREGMEGLNLDKEQMAERLKHLITKVADMPAEKRAKLLKSLLDQQAQPEGVWAVLLSPYTLVIVAITIVLMIFLFLAYKIFQREVEKERRREEKKKLKQEKKKK